MKTKIVLLSLLLVLLAGCISRIDPETGKKKYFPDPNVVAKVEAGAEGALTAATVLGAIWPGFLALSTAIAAGIAVWRKMKPQVMNAQTEAELYHTATMVTVMGIEEFKKAYPKIWTDLEAKLLEIKAKIVKPEDQLKIENVIRALRGLPPIE